MSNKTEKNPLAEEYGERYLGPVFYFCLRRTGDAYAAEELASDITLQVLTALHKGTRPESFPAWVWQIARNRYARWAEAKSSAAAHVSPVDPDDPAAEGLLADAEGFLQPGVDSEYAHSEDIADLRRELAFLARDWREVVVAFYIEDCSVGDIAARLGIPEGTVKTRLLRAREKLKEGMNMSRKFGTKSYKPEDVRFIASGSQPYGWPWQGVSRSLPKNILLEASGNPSTAEELSVAVGVAMPYMEEELALLVEGELLSPVGKRYVTNFYIESQDIQETIFAAIDALAADEADRVMTLCRDLIPVYRRLCTVPDTMDDDLLLWLILPRTVDLLAQHCKGYTMESGIRHKRPNESWGFMGFEGTGSFERPSYDHSGCGRKEPQLWAYTYQTADLPYHYRFERIEGSDTDFLADLLDTGRPIDTLSDLEREAWERLCQSGLVHAGADGTAVCDIPVCPKGTSQAIYGELLRHPLGAALQKKLQTLFDTFVSILGRESHKVLRVQLPYCASMHLLGTRAAFVSVLLARGALTRPADPARSVAGLYLDNI